MRYAYQYNGAPLLQWGRSAPLQSRAADSVALGSLGGSTLDEPTLLLPAPGAPEPIGVTRQGLSGCACHGSCGCGGGMGGYTDSLKRGALIGVAAVAGWALWKALKKR